MAKAPSTVSPAAMAADSRGGPARRKPARDDLFVKLHNVGYSDPAPLVVEIRERQAQRRQNLELYRLIRRNHSANPKSLPPRRQEEISLDWCEEALALPEPLTP
jgi:hypothetical protein